MERFTRIGELFTIYGSPLHIGAAIASSDAIYFVASQEPWGIRTLFTVRMGKSMVSAPDCLPSRVSDIDTEVTADDSWPLSTDSGFALILTKADVVRIRKPLFRSLKITTPQGRIVIRKGISQRFPALQTLADYGWLCG